MQRQKQTQQPNSTIRVLTWTRVPHEVRRRERPRGPHPPLLREVAARRGPMRARGGAEQPLEHVQPAEVQEHEPLHVQRPDAPREVVRQRVQREGEEVRGDVQREVVQVVRGGERVDRDGLHGGEAEDEGVERGGGREVLLRGEAIFGHDVGCGDEGVDCWMVVGA